MATAVEYPRFQRLKRLQRRTLHNMFELLARADVLTSASKQQSEQLDVFHDVDYGPYLANRLDIFRPRYAARPMPVMLYIHGGAFMLCSKRTHRNLAMENAIHGQYLVFNIDYRLAPRHKYPAAHEDACRAYRWVVDNCARYGGDPKRIVVAGESAGGNLALTVAVASSYRRYEPWAQEVYDAPHRPIAVQAIMPFLQVSNPGRQVVNPYASSLAAGVAKEVARAYLGVSRTFSASQTLMADPIRVMEECGAPDRPFPRVWSGVGTGDLCCDDVMRLEKRCLELDIPCEAHYYEGEVHAFHAFRWRLNAQRYWRDNFRFMRHVAMGKPVEV